MLTNEHFVLTIRDSTSTAMTPTCQFHRPPKTVSLKKTKKLQCDKKRKKKGRKYSVTPKRRGKPLKRLPFFFVFFSLILSSYCRTTGACRSFQFMATHKCDVKAARKLQARHSRKSELFGTHTLTQDQKLPDFQLLRKQRKQRHREQWEQPMNQEARGGVGLCRICLTAAALPCVSRATVHHTMTAMLYFLFWDAFNQ